MNLLQISINWFPLVSSAMGGLLLILIAIIGHYGKKTDKKIDGNSNKIQDYKIELGRTKGQMNQFKMQCEKEIELLAQSTTMQIQQINDKLNEVQHDLKAVRGNGQQLIEVFKEQTKLIEDLKKRMD